MYGEIFGKFGVNCLIPSRKHSSSEISCNRSHLILVMRIWWGINSALANILLFHPARSCTLSRDILCALATWNKTYRHPDARRQSSNIFAPRPRSHRPRISVISHPHYSFSPIRSCQIKVRLRNYYPSRHGLSPLDNRLRQTVAVIKHDLFHNSSVSPTIVNRHVDILRQGLHR